MKHLIQLTVTGEKFAILNCENFAWRKLGSLKVRTDPETDESTNVPR